MSARIHKNSASCLFDDAIAYFGGAVGLAKVLGIGDSQVRKIRVGRHRLLLTHACKIEELTGGKIKTIDLNSEFNKSLSGNEN